jgi:formate dehydrogenase beta subunit
MTTALILMGGMGLIISAVLALASKAFYVYVDPKVEAVDDALPGAN